MALSYSRLKMYKDCPHKYKLAYIDGNKFQSSIWARSGKKLHAEIAKRAEKIIEAGGGVVEFPGSEDEVLQLFTFLLPDRVVKYGIEVELAVDKNWELCDFNSPEAMFRGILDMYVLDDNGTLEIIDHKTGYRKLSQDDFENDLQLKLYALMLAQQYPQARAFLLTRYYVRLNIMQDMSAEADDLQEFKAEIEGLAKRIESDKEYKPIVSPDCVNCMAKHICKPYQGYLDIIPETIEEMAEKAKHYDRMKKDYDEIVKKVLDEREKIETENYTIEYPLVTQHKYNNDEVVEFLLENDVSPEAILKWGINFTNTNIEKLFRKINRPDLEAAVPSEMKHYNRISYKKKAKKGDKDVGKKSKS
jgi:hypothetical protein